MGLGLKKQGDKFSWSLARKNSLILAIEVSVGILVSSLVMDLLSQDNKPFYQHTDIKTYIALASFGICYIVNLSIETFKWWWRNIWTVNKRRKLFSYALVSVLFTMPLTLYSVREFFIRTIDEQSPVVAILVLFLSSIPTLIIALPIGIFLSWFTIYSATLFRNRSSLANRIHTYFWGEDNE